MITLSITAYLCVHIAFFTKKLNDFLHYSLSPETAYPMARRLQCQSEQMDQLLVASEHMPTSQSFGFAVFVLLEVAFLEN
jgi:hypothetical protein